MKEQFTQFPPDFVVMELTLLNGEEHSVGLGAIYPTTAMKALDIEEYNKDELIDLQKRLLTDDIYNIEMIAKVLVYFANDLYSIDTISNLTLEEWKSVVGIYNAKNEEQQKIYSDKVYEYLDKVRELLKTNGGGISSKN